MNARLYSYFPPTQKTKLVVVRILEVSKHFGL